MMSDKLWRDQFDCWMFARDDEIVELDNLIAFFDLAYLFRSGKVFYPFLGIHFEVVVKYRLVGREGEVVKRVRGLIKTEVVVLKRLLRSRRF